jgi:EpsD family peptidyl-prolyl cis-trans isomerase
MPLHLRSTVATLTLSLLLCAAPGLRAAGDASPTPADDSSTVVARVGDDEVTIGQIRAALQNQDPKIVAAAKSDPSKLSDVVRSILAQKLVLKEALSKKFEDDPAVTAALDQLRNNAIAQAYLQYVSIPPKDYPSDADIQTAYDANKSKFLVPKQYDLAQIFIKNIKGSDADTAAKAQVKLETVRKALAKHGSDFAAIASADSDDTASGPKGGELGWVMSNRIQPEIATQIAKLSKGSISQPIRLDDGWHILKIIDTKEPYTPALDEIKPQLAQLMRTQRARANSQQYIAQILKDNPVQIDELSLSKVFRQGP